MASAAVAVFAALFRVWNAVAIRVLIQVIRDSIAIGVSVALVGVRNAVAIGIHPAIIRVRATGIFAVGRAVAIRIDAVGAIAVFVSFFNVRKGLSPPLDLTAGRVDMSGHKKRRGVVRALIAAPEKPFALPHDLLCHESNAWMDKIETTWHLPFRPAVRFTVAPAARCEPPQSAFDLKTMRLGQALGMGGQFPLLAAA